MYLVLIIYLLRGYGLLMGYLMQKIDSFVWFGLFICLTAYQFLMGYLMLKFDSFLNV